MNAIEQYYDTQPCDRPGVHVWSGIHAICSVCDEPIIRGEECFDMPDGECIHSDCLRDWAEQHQHIWTEVFE